MDIATPRLGSPGYRQVEEPGAPARPKADAGRATTLAYILPSLTPSHATKTRSWACAWRRDRHVDPPRVSARQTSKDLNLVDGKNGGFLMAPREFECDKGQSLQTTTCHPPNQECFKAAFREERSSLNTRCSSRQEKRPLQIGGALRNWPQEPFPQCDTVKLSVDDSGVEVLFNVVHVHGRQFLRQLVSIGVRMNLGLVERVGVGNEVVHDIFAGFNVGR